MINKKVTVRAFNKEGYHKDILIMNEKQLIQYDNRIGSCTSSLYSGLLGIGGRIDPAIFPEMEYFEIVLSDY
jgi:hypothetical protein